MRVLRSLVLALLLLFMATAPGFAQLITNEDGDQPITVESTNGIEWVRDGKMYVARGNAVATRGDVTVRGDTLTALYRDKQSGGTEIYRIEANGSVVITTPQERAVADRAVYDLDQSVVILLGDGLKFTSGEDVITATDSLEYWQDRNIAVARGDAVAVRETQRIRSDTMTAYFEKGPEGGQQISRVDALGNVVISTPQDVARGDEAVYTASEKTATLSGDVRITRGENQLNGERAVVNLETGISRLLPGTGSGASGNRVRGLFNPGEARQ
jgi:lipopolysaccharide export system protein LptA